MTRLSLDNTQILEVKRFIYAPVAIHSRQVKDYEIDYYLSGSRNMTVNNDKFNINEGTLVFRKPGQYVKSEGNYDMYTLTLNFDPDINLTPEHYRRDRNSRLQKLISHPLLDRIPTHFHPYRKHDYIRIFEKLCLCSYPMTEDYDEQQILLNELFLLINADMYHEKLQAQHHKNSSIKHCCKYINENFGKTITLNDLAALVNLAPNYFLRLFKQETGLTPKEYILQIRLEHARSLLSGTNLKITAIANSCGFKDSSYFSFFFKKRFGKTPLEYRNNKS